MRVATYNVHDCIGLDRRYHPQRIAGLVRDLQVDVVVLQEVTLDHQGDVLAQLEEITGMQGVDGTLFDRGVGRYGNLLLTRWPVCWQRLHDLSFRQREPRGVVEAEIDIEGQLYRVLVTHLGLASAERHQQIRSIAELAGSGPEPVVLMGDFNVWFGAWAFHPLIEVGFEVSSRRTFPTWPRPLLALDRILVRRPASLVREWLYRGSGVQVASDHWPLLAEVEMHPHQ